MTLLSEWLALVLENDLAGQPEIQEPHHAAPGCILAAHA
jgi:hypothetical protein